LNVTHTELPGVLIIEPRVFREERGWFMESFSAARYAAEGMPSEFAQDNVSYSVPGVLRGLHYQHPIGQGKLVGVLEGEVYDVAVDIRPDSPTFRRWVAVTLSSDNHKQLWIPVGYAHAFVARKPSIVTYKASAAYDPNGQRSVLWCDEEIGIEWPEKKPLLSEKDACAPRLRDIAHSSLPKNDPSCPH
jgi:dTDP-4-dehydrorhamnose 3,5-epimerase